MELRFAVDCAVNPRTGQERELAPRHAARAKRVVVIGGGPAGLEAARVAGERGHRVTLFERGAQLGGALRWAAILHPENEPFLRYLRSEIARSHVNVELGRTISAGEVAGLSPHAVVVVPGGRIAIPAIPGDQLPHVRSGPALRELLARWTPRLLPPSAVRVASRAWMPGGRRVVIVGGDPVAVEIAEFLSRRGRLVSILQPGKSLAPEVGKKRRTEHMDRLDRQGVTVHVRASVERITDHAVVFTPAGGTGVRGKEGVAAFYDNNIAAAGPSNLDIGAAQFRELLDAHLGTVFATCRAAAPRMVTQGGGSIVNTSSAAFLGDYGGTGYPAGKGAVNSLTLAIAAQLKEHRVPPWSVDELPGLLAGPESTPTS